MKKYKTLLIFPIFKNKKYIQNVIFDKVNFISRSYETRSLVNALGASIIHEKIINIGTPKSSLLINDTVVNETKENFDFSKYE